MWDIGKQILQQSNIEPQTFSQIGNGNKITLWSEEETMPN